MSTYARTSFIFDFLLYGLRWFVNSSGTGMGVLFNVVTSHVKLAGNTAWY